MAVLVERGVTQDQGFHDLAKSLLIRFAIKEVVDRSEVHRVCDVEGEAAFQEPLDDAQAHLVAAPLVDEQVAVDAHGDVEHRLAKICVLHVLELVDEELRRHWHIDIVKELRIHLSAIKAPLAQLLERLVVHPPVHCLLTPPQLNHVKDDVALALIALHDALQQGAVDPFQRKVAEKLIRVKDTIQFVLLDLFSKELLQSGHDRQPHPDSDLFTHASMIVARALLSGIL